MVFELLALILFLIGIIAPGYCLSLVFFPSLKKLDFERIIVSLALGITILPLFLLLENTLFKIKLDFISVSANIFLISIVALAVYFAKIKLKK